MSKIKFGTDGWRGILNKDFTIENADKVINSIASFIYKKSKYDKSIIIGYDPRNKADEFAFHISDKLSNFGFNTEISSKIIATPVIAYTALKKHSYALMVTASHNPPEYLGIKFIPPYGGPAEDYIVQEITENIDMTFTSKRDKTTCTVMSFEADYKDHLKRIINFDIIKDFGLAINYDGHHGAAGKLFKEILDENNIKNNCQNLERDINFGGYMPDPKEKYLPSLKSLCKKNGLIGLSNDGDGDRFGVFDEKGIYISANDIIAMLLKHLVVNKNYSGKLAKTSGASSMLDLYAKKLGIEVTETPIGFKWLGLAMRKENIIIAGEESGGLSIKGHIPEKDGILANLLIMEMLAYFNKKLCDLHDEFLIDLGKKFINDRIDLKLDSKDLPDKIIKQFKEYDKIGDDKIIRKSTIDGLKMYLEDNKWILIRKSGTEPLLRIYFETNSEDSMLYLKNEIKRLCGI